MLWHGGAVTRRHGAVDSVERLFPEATPEAGRERSVGHKPKPTTTQGCWPDRGVVGEISCPVAAGRLLIRLAGSPLQRPAHMSVCSVLQAGAWWSYRLTSSEPSP